MTDDNSPALSAGQDDSPGLSRLWAEKREQARFVGPRAFGKVSVMRREATRNAKDGDLLCWASPSGERLFRFRATDGGRWIEEL